MKGEYAKATNACNEGLAIDSTDSGLNYQLGVIDLISGETTNAYACAMTAFEYAEDASAFATAGSLYSLCAQLSGETDINDAIIEDMEYYGFTVATEVDKIINGELTIEDVFTTGKGVFSWE